MPRNSQQTTEMPQTKTVVAASTPAPAAAAPTVSAQPSAGDATVKRVRRPKAEGETAAAAAAPAAAVATPAAAASSEVATPKAPRASKASAAVAAPAAASAATAAAPAAPAAPAVAASGAGESSSDEAVSEVDALKQRLTAALEAVRVEKARLQEVGKNLVTLVETLVRDTNTVLRKSLRRKRRTGTSNANSGFLKPKLVTQELCAFLERPAGTQMSRTEVTRSICDYIKRNELQDKKNRRIIVPDQRLSGLLKLEKGQTLTYFDLQSKMNHLFAAEETA
jgi:hypothetical protein